MSERPYDSRSGRTPCPRVLTRWLAVPCGCSRDQARHVTPNASLETISAVRVVAAEAAFFPPIPVWDRLPPSDTPASVRHRCKIAHDRPSSHKRHRPQSRPGNPSSRPYYPFLSNRDSTSVGAETRCGRRSGSFSIHVVARRIVSVPIPTIVSNDGFETPDGTMDRVHDKRTFVISTRSIRVYRWRAYVELLHRGLDTVSEPVEQSFLTAEQPRYVRYSRTKWSNKPNGYVAGSDAVVRGCIASRSMGRPGWA